MKQTDNPQVHEHQASANRGWSTRSVVHLIGALPQFWSSQINRATVELVAPKPGEVVLDLGAGLGPATVTAAKLVRPDGRLIAVDPSRMARGILGLRRMWQRSRTAIDIRNGTAENLPVRDSSIDAVFAVNSVHHFADLQAAAFELARTLKPGGRVVLVEEDFTSPMHPASSHFAGPSPTPIDGRHLRALFQGEGFIGTKINQRTIGGIPATVATAAKPRTSGIDHQAAT